jgi:SepF-like predicted cell division protein (DUF552 family)
MFNLSKIVKKNGEKHSELEEVVAKSLVAYEQSQPKDLVQVKQLSLTSAEEIEYTLADGTNSKYILIRIPFRSLAAFRKVGADVIVHLEGKFKWPVIIVANRTIISKNGKSIRQINAV